jgi:flagellar hook-basal body complex protein FliE
MIDPIQAARIPLASNPLPQRSAGGADFAQLVSNAVDSVSLSGKSASASVERFLNGEGEELHRVILEQQTAALQFDLFVQVRNKVVQAYQEIMRMPL